MERQESSGLRALDKAKRLGHGSFAKGCLVPRPNQRHLLGPCHLGCGWLVEGGRQEGPTKDFQVQANRKSQRDEEGLR